MTNRQDMFSYGKRVTLRQLTRPALRWRSHNLICREKGLVVGFTPKAGCSFVAKLFFHNTADHKAERYMEWPHRYRIAYQQIHPVLLSDWVTSKVTRIKFVRNPFARAVSSYFQAMQTKLNAAIARSHDRDHIDWSFENYLDWLSTTRIDLTNPHFSPQKFWGESTIFKYDMIVRIEDIGDTIPLSKGGSLLVPGEIRSSRHHSERKPHSEYVGSTNFSHMRQASGAFPTWECFYNDETTEEVTRLYRGDFDAYGYNLNISRR